MLDTLSHRGPDAQGLYQSQQMLLGHRRLAIIDLSEAARQPLSNEDGSLWLSFNGEIYNYRGLRDLLVAKGHRFKSETDSEVILHLYEEYGKDSLNSLSGMFAFALWDERKRCVFLARDRLGIKPLYYSEQPGTLIFASEVRAILASGLVSRDYDRDALIKFLQYGSIPTPYTVFQHIRMLPAAHYLLRDNSGMSIRPYWNLSDSLHVADDGPVNLECLRELFFQTVKRHLVSDVGVGILLSGGMDSSSLAAAAFKGGGQKFHTLTIAFDEDRYDESCFARVVSQRFGSHHHERRLTSGMMVQEIPAFLQAMDQPTVDGLNTFMVAKAAREEGLRVLLSGLGGDEVFFGYPHFKHVAWLFRALPFLKNIPPPVRQLLVGGLIWEARWAKLSGADRLHYLQNPSLASAYCVYRGLFPPRAIQSLLDDGRPCLEPVWVDGLFTLPSDLDRAAHLEFKHYLHDQLLRDTDVMSMRHSIEIRVPFLDHEFVEAVLRIAARKRFHSRKDKWLLRKIVQDELPKTILNRSKQGFILPMSRWMSSSLKGQVEAVLLDSEVGRDGCSISQNVVRKIWQQFLEGTVHWSQPWALFVLKYWLDRTRYWTSTGQAGKGSHCAEVNDASR